uniref:Uncharacterized protein n=1 Tax=Anguilla anguilla TaxID=7936 RepID=A0A0E9VXK5_ANGAN
MVIVLRIQKYFVSFFFIHFDCLAGSTVFLNVRYNSYDANSITLNIFTRL